MNIEGFEIFLDTFFLSLELSTGFRYASYSWLVISFNWLVSSALTAMITWSCFELVLKKSYSFWREISISNTLVKSTAVELNNCIALAMVYRFSTISVLLELFSMNDSRRSLIWLSNSYNLSICLFNADRRDILLTGRGVGLLRWIVYEFGVCQRRYFNTSCRLFIRVGVKRDLGESLFCQLWTMITQSFLTRSWRDEEYNIFEYDSFDRT